MTWSKAEVRQRPNCENILISGFFNEVLGIGKAAHLTAKTLEKLGFDVEKEDLRPFDKGLLSRGLDRFQTANNHSIWIIQANPNEAEIALYTHDPHQWSKLYRIGYWVWESSIPPQIYIDLADYFHEIWVPSHYVKEVLLNAFNHSNRPHNLQKLRVVPHPVAPSYEYTVHKNNEFNALYVFDPRSDFQRKNPEAVLKTWIAAFPEPDDDKKLIIKTLKLSNFYPAFQTLIKIADKRKDIVFIVEDFSEDEMNALLLQCQLYISLHRSEGFGLPLAEAMARGLIVMATDNSGNNEFMTTENSLLVRSTPIPANRLYNGPKALWREPDLDQAVKMLKIIANDQSLRLNLFSEAIKMAALFEDQWKNILLK